MDNALQIASDFCDKSIRADEVLHLATMCMDPEAWSDVASEAFAQDADHIAAALEIPELAEALENWEIAERLQAGKRFGFLVQFSTPEPDFSSSGEVISFSWGWTRCGWIYADSYEAACQLAIKWRDDVWTKPKQPTAEPTGAPA